MLIGTTRLTCLRGDITRQGVDAIVNAANTTLLGGGGVDGAIHRAAGRQLLEQCRAVRARQGGCRTGEAVITGGGRLAARFVVHTVGPVWRDGTHEEPDLLARAYASCLRIALENGVRTIAFPSISTGAFGFPIDLAAPIAVATARAFVSAQPGFEEIRFVLFEERDHRLYRRLLGEDDADAASSTPT